MDGDISDLIDSEILVFDERRKDNEDQRWTFYHITTRKGSVVLRFYGESNYYCIDVNLYQIQY